MKKIILLLVVFMLLTSKAYGVNHRLLNYEFVMLVNKERALAGEKPLSYSDILYDLATIRTVEMKEYGSLGYIDKDGKEYPHRRTDGRQWHSVFTDQKVNFIGTVGENLAMVSIGDVDNERDIAIRLFEVWKDSPTHYDNMVSPNYNATGLGFSEFEGLGYRYIISTNLFSTPTESELRQNSPDYIPRHINVLPIAETPKTEPVLPIKVVDDRPTITVPAKDIIYMPNPQITDLDQYTIYYLFDGYISSTLVEFVIDNRK